jgi:hypothetical protein
MNEAPLDPADFGAAFRAFIDAMTEAAEKPENPLHERILAHLGMVPSALPVVTEEYDDFEHPNLQLAIDEYIAQPARQAELVGLGGVTKQYQGFGLSEMLSSGDLPRYGRLSEGPVDYVNFHLAGDTVLPCVDFGLYLLRDGKTAFVVFLAGPSEHGPNQKLRIEVASSRPEHAQAFISELTAAMNRLNVYRGHVISLSPGQFGPGRRTIIAFHDLPTVTREDVILPEGILDRIERQTIIVSERADVLLAAGRSLKRGLLLYGPPGVGKTLTVQYLTGRMRGRTVLLTTGLGLGLLRPVTQMARALAPTMVVLEDVDLIAEGRGMPYGHSSPLLFELLNEMDGLQEDNDIIFVLTTNRPEALEPALAARPGRVDLAVELPLPDGPSRRRLLERYARGLQLENVDLDAIAERIGGATPAYIKELLRKAAVIAAASDSGTLITEEHIETALSELDEGGRLARRLLGFRAADEPDEGTAIPPFGQRAMPSGFPAAHVSRGEEG